MAESFTGKSFSEAIAESLGVSKAKANEATHAAFNALVEHLVKGDRVAIAELGIFSIATRSARTGRNPATGQAIQIEEKRVVKFRPAKSLGAACNPPKKIKKK